MANYQKIIRLHPEIHDFLRFRGRVYRGDIMAYPPNVTCDALSTDSHGFRHSTFRGERLSLQDCVKRERYGIATGASNINGFGVAGNENTLSSLLAERFGFPFANAGMPGGNSRNLHSFLLDVVARAPNVPAIVVHFSGGDYSTFCVSSIADRVYGSPNRLQLDRALKERGGQPDATKALPELLEFTSLWTRAINELCRTREIPLVLGNDTTFFEKDQPTAIEQDCDLGRPTIKSQQRQFANHRKFGNIFYPWRRKVAESIAIPLAGPDRSDGISFVDEFHPDAAGTKVFADDVAKAIEPLL